MIFSHLVANLHQKCNLQDAFLIFFLLWYILSSYFCKNVLPAPARSTFLKTNSEQSAFKNPFFGALNALNGGSVGHIFGTYRSFAPSVRLFSASVAHQNFNFRLEKCVFPVYEPSWKPPFSINCSIECILNDLLIFSHWFVHHFVKIASGFCKFYENVLPAKAGSTFSKADFCQHLV